MIRLEAVCLQTFSAEFNVPMVTPPPRPPRPPLSPLSLPFPPPRQRRQESLRTSKEFQSSEVGISIRNRQRSRRLNSGADAGSRVHLRTVVVVNRPVAGFSGASLGDSVYERRRLTNPSTPPPHHPRPRLFPFLLLDEGGMSLKGISIFCVLADLGRHSRQ